MWGEFAQFSHSCFYWSCSDNNRKIDFHQQLSVCPNLPQWAHFYSDYVLHLGCWQFKIGIFQACGVLLALLVENGMEGAWEKGGGPEGGAGRTRSNEPRQEGKLMSLLLFPTSPGFHTLLSQIMWENLINWEMDNL